MRVYISGPISMGGASSLDDIYARLLRFDMAEHQFEQRGIETYNAGRPDQTLVCKDETCNSGLRFADGTYQHTWDCYMRYHIKNLMDCDTLAALPEWEHSTGATLEHHIASELGYQIIYLDKTGAIL